VGAMPSSRNEQEEEARLLYVAMTRSIDRLVLTCDRKSEFVQRLNSALSDS
jgi:superfamily I DNA/RNA helicase